MTESDMIEYLAEDTRGSLLHMWNRSGDGQRFMRAAKTAVLKKPLVILKAGKKRGGRESGFITYWQSGWIKRCI